MRNRTDDCVHFTDVDCRQHATDASCDTQADAARLESSGIVPQAKAPQLYGALLFRGFLCALTLQCIRCSDSGVVQHGTCCRFDL